MGRAGRRIRRPWRARAAEQGAGLALIGLSVAAAALLATMVAGLALRGAAAAIRAEVASDPAGTSVVLATEALPDEAAQDAAVRRLVARELPGLPVAVVHASTAGPLPARGGGSGQALLVRADPGLVAAVRIVRGGTGGALVDSAGAAALGIRPGATVAVGDAGSRISVRVSGVWTERDARDPVWAGLGRGAQASVARLLVPEAVLAAAGDTAEQWSVTPGAVAPAALGALTSGLQALPQAAQDDAQVTGTTVVASGDGAAAAARMAAAEGGAAALLPGAAAVLAIAVVLAVLLLAGVVADAREPETRLLLIRGASPRRLVTVAVAETGAVAVLGAVAGTAAAAALLASAGPPTGWVEVVLPPLAVVVAVEAAAVAVAVRAVAAADGRTAGRRRLPALVPAGLLVVTAAVATWRFLTAETPGSPPDPVGVLAPALLLGTAAVAALLALPLAARLVAVRSGRGNGLVAPLAVRQLARDVGAFTTAVAAVTLAVGGVGAAAGLVGTWSAFVTRSTALSAGADVRAAYAVDPVAGAVGDLLPIARVRAIPGVGAAWLARETDATVQGRDLTLIAEPAARIPAAGRGLAAAPAGLRLPPGTTAIHGEVSGTAPTVGLWFQDADGSLLHRVTPAFRGGDLPTALPSGVWSLVAVDVSVTSETPAEVRLDSAVTTSGERRIAARWLLAGSADGGDALPTGLGASVVSKVVEGLPLSTATVRLMPSSRPLPVLLDAAAAAASSERVGEALPVEEQQGSFRGVVAGVVPVVPGTSGNGAAAVDLAAVERAELAAGGGVPTPDEVWLSASDAPAVAAAVGASSGLPQVTLPEAGLTHRFADGTVAGLLLAAGGATVFAVLVVAAAVATTTRRRRGEVAVLRALGAKPGQQVRARTAEALGALGAGVLAGVVAAFAVTWLTAAPLARLADGTAPGALDPVLTPLPSVLLAGAAVLAAGWAAVLAVAARRLRRAAR